MPWDEQLRPELASGSTAAVTFGRRATHAEARAPVEDSLDRRMRRAKDLPDLAEAAKHHTKTVANIRLPPPANAARLLEIEAEFQELEKKIAEFENPKTKQARELVLVTYREFCVSLDPGLPDGDEWLEACVEKNTVRFIWWRLKTTRGQKNRQFVKASTLRSWVTMFILCVVWYCRGPNGEAIGIALLARRGLYDTLKRALKTMVREYKLDRFADERIYFGRFEVRLIIEQGLASSMSSTRVLKIQTILATLFTFYMGCRPSTLGPYCHAFLEGELFLKLGDITIFKDGPFTFRIRIRLGNFKGHNEEIGKEQYFWLTAVIRQHNVLFDVCVWLVCHLFLRGAFEQKTLNEIYALKDGELKIKKSKLKEALFLKGSPGGRVFIEPPTPVASRSISDSIKLIARNAGLPAAGTYALRREAGDYYTMIMGHQIASIIIAHASSNHKVLIENYSRGTAAIPVVGLRLDEVPGLHSGPLIEATKEMHKLSSAAVLAMVGRSDLRQGRDQVELGAETESQPRFNRRTVEIKLSKEEEIEVEHSPELAGLHEQVDHHWAAWIGTLALKLEHVRAPPVPLEKRQPSKMSCTAIRKYFTVRVGADDAESAEIKNRHDEALDALSRLWAPIVATRAKLRRRIKDAKEKEYDATYISQHNPTSDERAAAVKSVEQPSELLVQIAAAPQSQGARVPHVRVLTAPQHTDSPAWQQYEAATRARVELSNTEEDPDVEQAVTAVSQRFKNLFSFDLDDKDDDSDSGVSAATDPTTTGKSKAKANDRKGKGKARSEPTAGPVVPEPEPTVEIGGVMTASEQMDDEHGYRGPDLEADERALEGLDSVSCDLLRQRLAEYICEPVLVERALKNQQLEDGGARICKQCIPFTHRSELRASFATDFSYKRHIFNYHTPWRQLELQMLQEGDDFCCPAGDYEANTIPMVQRHCLSDDCVSADEHRELLELHRSRTRVLFRPATEERKALDKARALVEDPDVLQATAEHILGPSPKDFIQRVQQEHGRELDAASRDVIASAVSDMLSLARGKGLNMSDLPSGTQLPSLSSFGLFDLTSLDDLIPVDSDDNMEDLEDGYGSG